ncbi:MAG: Omp28-related outer membrane protein [Aureispira sp.]|nr:Omp28-related outer membrane protein [Aureispira sp.]
MKRLITIFTFIAFCSVVVAQNYHIHTSTGGRDDSEFFSGAYDFIFDNNVWSNNSNLSQWYDLPFDWYFYGQKVTGYHMSENGYITFDNLATQSFGANTSLPSTVGPNNAIYAFWDDLTRTASYSFLRLTYGEAPNRVYIIMWQDMNYISSPSSDGVTVSLVLYESCADFDIMIERNNMALAGTIGCENSTGTIGAQVTGSPNIAPPTTLSYNDADNIVYTFQYQGAVDNDLALIAFDLDNHMLPGTQYAKAAVRNLGNQNITSFDLNYSIDGGPVLTESFSGLNINNTDGKYEFTGTTPIIVNAAGEQHTICAWPSNINNNNDQRSCNDTLCEYITGIQNISAKQNLLLEEFTGTWCGYCIDGSVVLDNMENTYGDSLIIVSIHDGDSMEFDEGLRRAFAQSAYPNGLLNRKALNSSGNYEKEQMSRGWWNYYAVPEFSSFTPVDLTIQHSYDSVSRALSAVVNADYTDYSAGEMGVILMIVEDSLSGPNGSGWSQANSYNNTNGHPYFGAGGSVDGFIHRHVLRDYIESGPFGKRGLIPSFVTPGSNYAVPFQAILPAHYNPHQVHLVAALVQFTEGNDAYVVGVPQRREVYNSVQVELLQPTMPTTVMEKKAQAGEVNIYPSPMEQQAIIYFSNPQELPKWEVKIYDLSGKLVHQCVGTEKQTALELDAPAGVYISTIQTTEHIYHKRFIIR